MDGWKQRRTSLSESETSLIRKNERRHKANNYSTEKGPGGVIWKLRMYHQGIGCLVCGGGKKQRREAVHDNDGGCLFIFIHLRLAGPVIIIINNIYRTLKQSQAVAGNISMFLFFSYSISRLPACLLSSHVVTSHITASYMSRLCTTAVYNGCVQRFTHSLTPSSTPQTRPRDAP